jgi:hypothetical protein
MDSYLGLKSTKLRFSKKQKLLFLVQHMRNIVSKITDPFFRFFREFFLQNLAKIHLNSLMFLFKMLFYLLVYCHNYRNRLAIKNNKKNIFKLKN